MTEQEIAYYARRAQQERAAAEKTDGIAASRHRNLADLYQALVDSYRKPVAEAAA